MFLILLMLLILLSLLFAANYKTYRGGNGKCEEILIKYKIWPYEATIITKDSMLYNMMSEYIKDGDLYYNLNTGKFVYTIGDECNSNIPTLTSGTKCPIAINELKYRQFARKAKESLESKKDIAKLSNSLLKMYEEGKYRDVSCAFKDDDLDALLYPKYEPLSSDKTPSRTNPVDELNMNAKLADISEQKKYASIIEESNKILKLLPELTK